MSNIASMIEQRPLLGETGRLEVGKHVYCADEIYDIWDFISSRIDLGDPELLLMALVGSRLVGKICLRKETILRLYRGDISAESADFAAYYIKKNIKSLKGNEPVGIPEDSEGFTVSKFLYDIDLVVVTKNWRNDTTKGYGQRTGTPIDLFWMSQAKLANDRVRSDLEILSYSQRIINFGY